LSPEQWITDFVSTGPKSYAFRLNDGRSVVKFKGVSCTLYNLDRINLAAMLRCLHKHRPRAEAVDPESDRAEMEEESDDDEAMSTTTSEESEEEEEEEEEKDPSLENPKNLVFRANRFGEVRTFYQAKAWDLVYDKRWIDWNTMKTYPFGY
jgi:hypothetical protein